jgi:4-hydroxy-tetrahydrodipicolinate synthase
MVTPFRADLEIDYQRASELAVRLVDGGSDGIVVGGTTGESPSLDHREKLKLFETVLEAVGDRAVVVAGTGTNSTADSVRLTRQAEAVGIRAVMLVCPYYNKPPQEGLYQHFKTIAAATDLPVMLYNVPGRTSVNMLPATAVRLAAIDNIVALKEASGNLEQVSEICCDVPPGFRIYSGDDSLTLPVLAVGGHGVVSVASHLVGRQIAEMCRSYKAGDVAGASKLHHELFGLFRAVFVTTNPIPVKAALALAGFDCGPCRLPLIAPTEAELGVLRQAMEKHGLVA